MNARTNLLALALVSLALIGMGGGAFYLQLKNSAVTDALHNAESTAFVLSEQISFYFSNNRRTSHALSGAPPFSEALVSRTPESLEAANRLLDHGCIALSAAVCYLMDQQGTTLASSNRNTPTSFVGKNYNFRPYFKKAREGTPAVYLALGVTSKKRGIYFSSPVHDAMGFIRGVLVIKAPVDDLENQFDDYPGIAALIDAEGVVFASNQIDWMFQSIHPLSKAEAEAISKTRQFGSGKPTWLGLKEISEDRVAAPDGSTYLISYKPLDRPMDWRVAYLFDMADISIFDPTNSINKLFALGFGVIFLITGVFVVFLFRTGSKDLKRRNEAEEALRDNERRLQNFIDSSPSNLSYIGNDLRYRQVNARYLEFVGKTEEQVIGHSVAEVLGKEPFDLYRPWIEKALQGSEQHFQVERPLRELGLRHLEVRYVPNRDSNGNILGFHASAQDITDRKNLEEQFRKAQNLEAIGQLAGGIAHEFNNLLQLIMGFNNLTMNKLNPSDPNYRNLERINEATERGAVLVKKMLGFGRKEILRPTIINANDLIASLAEFLESTLGEQIILNLELDADLPPFLGDQGALEQILLNLCLNARDAMKDGGTLLLKSDRIPAGSDSLRKYPDLPAGDWVRISVVDTGEGMSQEVMDHIFEPFFTTKGPQEGSGLGLSMVYGLVQQHGGVIEVSSNLGKDSTFEIYFPAHEGSPPEEEEGTIPALELSREQGTILIAEDEEGIQLLTSVILEEENFAVLNAHDGEEAILLFDRHRKDIDLVILDVVMPKLNGVEIYKHIRQLDPSIPIVFQTGYELDSEKAEFISRQNIPLLHKPYSPVKLKEVVAECVLQAARN